MSQQQPCFSNNGKVSIRQMSRMLFLELFGLTTLVLPGPLARLCRTDGVFAIGAAAAVWALLLKAGGRFCDREGASLPVSAGIRVWVRVMKALAEIGFFCLAGGFLAYLLTSVVERQLLGSSYLWVILISVTVAGGYGILKGIESRARVYEVLFWILMVPLCLLLLIGIWNVRPSYLFPFFVCGWKGFLGGFALSFVAFSPAGLVFLLRPFSAEPEKAAGTGALLVCLAGGACMGVYLLLVGIFQTELLALLKYPVLSFMAVVELPGNLLERLDAPMMIIWFFCLFALFHSLCYYCADGIHRLFPKFRHSGRRAAVGMGLIFVVAIVLFLNGCQRSEPEDQIYPLAAGIDYETDTERTKVTCACPGAEGETIHTVSADSLFLAQEQLATESHKKVDLNHMKVFVLSREFLQRDKEREQLLNYFLENENMAWNTCVVFAGVDMDRIFCPDQEREDPLGIYLEELIESQSDSGEKSVFTMKDFMSLCKNERETMLVPVIGIKDGQILQQQVCIVSRGRDRGLLTLRQGACAGLLMGQQKTFSIPVDETTYVTIQDVRIRRRVKTDESGKPKQQVLIQGNAKLAADWQYDRERKDEILKLAEERLTWELTELLVTVQKEQHADLTNSFITLPLKNRALWNLYRDNPDAYEKQLKTTVEVRLKWLEL